MRKFKCLFSVLFLILLLFTFSISAFADAAVFSFGNSNHDYENYPGQIPLMIEFVNGEAEGYYSDMAVYVVDPVFSQYSEDLGSDATYTESYDYAGGDIAFIGNTTYSDFYIDSALPYTWVDREMCCNVNVGFDNVYFRYSDQIRLSASDYYIYLPWADIEDSDPFSQIELYFPTGWDSNLASLYDDFYFEMEYVYGGSEVSSDNLMYYRRDIEDPSSFSFSPGNDFFESLPADENTLIYVQSARLIIDSPDIDSSVSFYFEYFSYDLDYRNIDLSSYVSPSSPINPEVFRDYTGWIGTAVGGFLDLQLVDGFTLGGILMVLVAFMIALWFLKVFAGG